MTYVMASVRATAESPPIPTSYEQLVASSCSTADSDVIATGPGTRSLSSVLVHVLNHVGAADIGRLMCVSRDFRDQVRAAVAAS